MKYDIELCKSLGIDGIVLGLLNDDGTIDKVRTKTLVEVAKPMVLYSASQSRL
jgi:copper homeostasis protein